MSTAQFKPFEPQLIDDRYLYIDGRVQDGPCSMLVDAIHPDKLPGGRIAKHSQKQAIRSAGEALYWLTSSESKLSEMTVPLAALHCLFAIQALAMKSPIAILAGDCANGRRAMVARLRRCEGLDRKGLAIRIVDAVMQVAHVIPSNESIDAALSQQRSWAWSGYVPGIMMVISNGTWDVEQPQQTIGD